MAASPSPQNEKYRLQNQVYVRGLNTSSKNPAATRRWVTLELGTSTLKGGEGWGEEEIKLGFCNHLNQVSFPRTLLS